MMNVMNESPKGYNLQAEELIRAAIVKARRPAGPLRREGILRLLRRLQPRRHLWLKLSQELSTAAWRLHCCGAQEVHEIRIGVHFARPCAERIQGQPRKLQRYCEALLRHECAHGMFSETDLDAIAVECKNVGLPFGLLNLLEDARIEHLERERSRDPKSGKVWRFHWWCFTPSPVETARPGQYFWSLVNREASSWKRYSAGAPRWIGKVGVDARVRDYYYHNAIHAKTTRELIPLGAEYMKEFPVPAKKPSPTATV